MCSKLCKRGDIGRFKASVGSCNVTDKSCLLEEATITTYDLTGDENWLSDNISIDLDEDTGTDPYFNDWEERIKATLESDGYMASAAHGSPRKNISAHQISKVWKIDRDSAKRKLGVTSQHCKRKVNPDLSRNYPTGDRMLWYKWLKEFFFMDTFFVTQNTSSKKKSRMTTSECDHTCCHLSVTDKGFISVVLMITKKEVPQVMKKFAKEIGALDAITCDAA